MTDDRTTTSRSGDSSRPAPARGGPHESPGAPPIGGAPRYALTQEDIRRLTLYKWRYSLESSGFTTEQVGRLLFLKWLHANHALSG